MITIKFEYGIDTELQRVKNTLNEVTWLDNNRYKYFLPASIEKTEKDDEVLTKAIEKEYSSTEFKEAENAITIGWEKRADDVERIQKIIIGASKFDELNLMLTKYGTSGSYRPPNKIIINLKDKIPGHLIKTVIHESIHLMVENLVLKNKVDHWRKERIVNLIIDKEFQSAYEMNNSPEYAKDVDVIFKEFYPNIILITEESGKLKTPDKIS